MSAATTWTRGEPMDPAVLDRETRILDELRRGEFARWAGPGGYLLREELTGHPERLFLFRLDDGTWYAGYKTISDYVLEQDMPGLLCSRVYWFNVVGRVESLRTSGADARIAFRPLDVASRHAAFDAIGPLTELTHPFPRQREPGRDKTSPPDGWLVTRERASLLGIGEQHVRRYTREFFRQRLAGRAGDVVAFDPACSTGQFLSEFARLDPGRIRTVGQDLSGQMVAMARGCLDEVHHGDARVPAVPPGSVDVLFSRFLNVEVVSTTQAREILPALVATLRPGGLMVVLGHTPPLLDAVDLVNAGLRVERAVARAEDYVFHYYVCEWGG